MVLDVEVYPKMPRKKSKAIPEGNGPIPKDAYVIIGGITREKLRRVMPETMGKTLEEFKKDMKGQSCLASLKQDARQPRLAMEADVTATKRPASARRAPLLQFKRSMRIAVLQNGSKRPDQFDQYLEEAEPPALPRRHDALVDNGVAAPKSCLSPLEIRIPTAAGGLLPTGKAFTTTRITYNQPHFRLCPTEETNSKRASIQYASYYSSFWINNQLDAPFCRRVIEKKMGQTLVFDPGGSTGHLLRAYPFWGTCRALLCGEVLDWTPTGDICSVFWQIDDSESSSCRGTGESFTPYVLRTITVSPQPSWFGNVMPSTSARDHLSYGGERISGNAMERGA